MSLQNKNARRYAVVGSSRKMACTRKKKADQWAFTATCMLTSAGEQEQMRNRIRKKDMKQRVEKQYYGTVS